MTYLFRLKLLAVVVKDERYAAVAQGVQAVMGFILDCRTFFQRFDGAAGRWETEIRTAREILDDARLGEPPLDGMSWRMVARYHYLFGHVLHQEIGRLCAILYEMDLGIAVGVVAQARGFTWARARRAEDNVFHAAALRHPGLDKAVGNSMKALWRRTSSVLFLHWGEYGRQIHAE